MDVEDAWFQQDGATAHTAWRSMQVLWEIFPGKLISLRGDVGWPGYSPDLAPCGAISNQRCTHTDLKTFKPSRTLFAGKSPLFPLQWPNESCEHSEIVSRSLSLMMATTLEISFLKHDDKNYFIYPFLCYNEFFCIFYSFYRINVWNVVLIFGSPCSGGSSCQELDNHPFFVHWLNAQLSSTTV